ncbi:MAG: hypothetical protein Q4E75_04190 [bacterium]|nr:hypothetical protein [bacterium]
MGFLEKVKNMFTEEVEDDIKIKKVKNEVTKVEIESPVKKDEDKLIENFRFKEENTQPIFFDESDFNDLNLIDKEEKTVKEEKPNKEKIKQNKFTEKKEYSFYQKEEKKEDVKEEKKNFKPTPIISPVYGILDKNYHKEDIVSKNDVINNPKEPNVDSIRNKAYGTLEDELENTLFGSNSILFKKTEKEEDSKNEEFSDTILTDLTDDIGKELDEILIKKEKYADEESKQFNTYDESEEDLLGFIDSTLYKNGDEE